MTPEENNNYEKRALEAQEKLENRLSWYDSQAEIFRSRGWTVYYRTENWGKDNPGYERKLIEMRRIMPESITNGVDFILCNEKDDIKGFSEAHIVHSEWTDKQKSKLHRIRNMAHKLDYFCFFDEGYFETYIGGEFYGLLEVPLSPDEIETVLASRRERKNIEKIKEAAQHIK